MTLRWHNKNDLKVLEIDTDKFPVWAVCMDDLLVCRDMFKSPLIFLHYLQERKKASQSEILNVADEIDHMAAYFTHLNYAKRAENIAFGGKLLLLRYQALFDKYYAYANMDTGQSPLPTVKAPKFCLEIINFLWKKLGYKARPFVFYMLNYGFRDVTDIENQYEKLISDQQIDKRLKALHFGNKNGITLYAAPRSFLNTQSKESLKKYLSAIMRARSGSERLLLIVELDDSWSYIEEVDPEIVKMNLQIGDENSELEALNFKRRQLKKRLSEKSNKLGRNDFCPCGSGKKYKQCCELIKNVLLS